MSGPAGEGATISPRLGSVFGRYRIESILGRGGMGVVFLATDIELERPVALKFLAPELAQDPAFRERFVRESRLAAAIEHPAIVPIYEAGAVGDDLFIAMRYVPGSDLGAILRGQAPLSVERTLAIATRLADALDAAHRRGLVHRDVKPGNVLVELDGEERAYLTDFGLTRRTSDLAPWSTTGPMGTLDYMAPEAIARGGIDGRADQYSLACLLFHCLSGQPPFGGETEAALLYAHVHADPPALSARRPGLGPELDAALKRGMAKDPAARFPDCRSLVAAIASGSGSGPRRPVSGRRRGRGPGRDRVAGVALVGVVALGAAGLVALLVVLGGRPTTTATHTMTGAPGSAGATRAPTAITKPSPAAGGSRAPGSPAVALVDTIIFASDQDGDYDIYRIDPAGGKPLPLTTRPRNERAPALSPDGRTIAFAVGPEGGRDIWLMDSDGSNSRQLTFDPADDYSPHWAPDGSLAFSSTRAETSADIFVLWNQGTGLSEELAVNITQPGAIDLAPAWAPQGRRLAFATNYWGGGRDIAVVDPAHPGEGRRITDTDDYDKGPTWSPDGLLIAFGRGPRDGMNDIWVTDRAGTEAHVVRQGPADDAQPDYSPDGSRIVYASGPLDATELFTMRADGSDTRQLTHGMRNAVDPDWGRIAAP